MHTIIYHMTKPGMLSQLGRFEVINTKVTDSLVDNLVTTLTVQNEQSFGDISMIKPGDVAIFKGLAYLVKATSDDDLQLIDIVNLFKVPYLTTGTIVSPNMVSLIAGLINIGIQRSSNGNAFSLSLTEAASNYQVAGTVSVDSSTKTSDQVMALIPDLYIKARKAALSGSLVQIRVDVPHLTKTQIPLLLDVIPTEHINTKYDAHRGLSELEVNRGTIDYNAALVMDTVTSTSSMYYLAEDGSITQTLPDYISQLAMVGVLYDSTNETATPAQLAKGQLPTTSGDNFTVVLSNDSILSDHVVLGSRWSLITDGKTLKGTLTAKEETVNAVTLTFGFTTQGLTLKF